MLRKAVAEFWEATFDNVTGVIDTKDRQEEIVAVKMPIPELLPSAEEALDLWKHCAWKAYSSESNHRCSNKVRCRS